MDQNEWSRSQWEAARMLVYRLQCEAQGRSFDLTEIGWHWLDQDDIVAAVHEDGETVSASDMLFAAVAIGWSFALAKARSKLTPEEDDDVATIRQAVLEEIQQLGLGLASMEPVADC